MIPTWFIISTFFIFLSINNFHNPLYDTAICIPSSLYTTYGFPVFWKYIFSFSVLHFQSILLYHTVCFSSMISANDSFDFAKDSFENSNDSPQDLFLFFQIHFQCIIAIQCLVVCIIEVLGIGLQTSCWIRSQIRQRYICIIQLWKGFISIFIFFWRIL